jgi:Mg-chelatase subunit ChlD
MAVSIFKTSFLFGYFLLAMPALAAQTSASHITMQTNVLFIVDNSASMWGLVNGTSKLDSSREILSKTLGDLPSDAKLGLVSFGHRHKGDCSDIEIISPMGSDDADTIYKKATALKAKGTTPLATTLMKAKDVFKDAEGAKMIVLITDGGEECGGDPCQAAKDLGMGGLVLRVNVVGFDLPKKEREELECIAREGAGKYFDVTDKKTLFKAIT